ncbi:MAG: YidC/Oxa1 family membrane protein insertase [Patescibacteria group bacterium]
MKYLYHILIYQPLFNLLIFFYNILPGNDIGIAIIALTIAVKLLLYPLSLQSIRSQRALQSLQPKLDALKQRYGDNKEALARATMELYKTEKVNPFSSCLPLLIQLPFFIALYQVFGRGLTSNGFEVLYPFITKPEFIKPMSFGFLDLTHPSIPLAVLAGLAQFWQSKMLVTKPQPQVPGAKDESMTAIMNKQMLYMMPLMTVFIGTKLPGGLSLYWLVTTLLTVAQQAFLFRRRGGLSTPQRGSSPST